eukprot:3773964-Pyramimonas_sp.AAC.1
MVVQVTLDPTDHAAWIHAATSEADAIAATSALEELFTAQFSDVAPVNATAAASRADQARRNKR